MTLTIFGLSAAAVRAASPEAARGLAATLIRKARAADEMELAFLSVN